MTRKVEFMLADSFDVTGEWWLPERPTEKLYGTLRYSPTNIELELSGTLDEVPAGDLMVGCVDHGFGHSNPKRERGCRLKFFG